MTYIPFDQSAHLGSPPWSADDPAVRAWESAHGHDVRGRCYAEYGCLVIESALEDEVERLRQALVRIGDMPKHRSYRGEVADYRRGYDKAMLEVRAEVSRSRQADQ